MKKYIILLAISFFSILISSSKPIENGKGLDTIKILEGSYSSNYLNEQCAPSWKWVGDDMCNINVRVDNPCNQRVYFYIILNNCSGPNCVRCYYVNPGSFLTQPINWCAGGTFYWGVCP